jgi:hypothetical protein
VIFVLSLEYTVLGLNAITRPSCGARHGQLFKRSPQLTMELIALQQLLYEEHVNEDLCASAYRRMVLRTWIGYSRV